jgi:hypothetical protein
MLLLEKLSICPRSPVEVDLEEGERARRREKGLMWMMEIHHEFIVGASRL